MKKQTIKINESQLKKIIAEATKRILKEGTTDPIAQKKWDYLIETVGPEHMLSSLYAWNSSNMINKWLEWFDEEGYFEGSPFDSQEEEFDDEEDFEDEDDSFLNEEFNGNIKSTTLGPNGPRYGITPNGEWYAFDPKTLHSYYCETEEEAKAKAEELKIKFDREEANSRRDWNLINSMD